MAIVKFRQVEERIWQRIDTIFFFRASETDKCAIPLTREDQTMQIFFHIIFHHFNIRTWQENPQKEILATPKYESKEEEQSGRTKQFKF